MAVDLEGAPGDLAQDDMEKLVEILTRYLPSVTEVEAKQVITRTLENYEAQLRAFLVSVAKAKLARMVRLFSALDQAETELLTPERLKNASTFELTRIWAVAQGASVADLDLISKVVEMRKKLDEVGAPSTVVNILNAPVKEQANALAEFALTPQQRDRVRDILTALVDRVRSEDENG
jgi:hypothetical protein